MAQIANINDAVQGGFITIEEVAVNPASIAAGAEGNTDVAVTGVKVGDRILSVSPTTALDSDLFLKAAVVQSADTIRFVHGNEGAGAVDGASLTYVVTVLHLS